MMMLNRGTDGGCMGTLLSLIAVSAGALAW
jgi:hypothetical protein